MHLETRKMKQLNNFSYQLQSITFSSCSIFDIFKKVRGGCFQDRMKENIILRRSKFFLNETLLKNYYAFRNRKTQQLNNFSYQLQRRAFSISSSFGVFKKVLILLKVLFRIFPSYSNLAINILFSYVTQCYYKFIMLTYH